MRQSPNARVDARQPPLLSDRGVLTLRAVLDRLGTMTPRGESEARERRTLAEAGRRSAGGYWARTASTSYT